MVFLFVVLAVAALYGMGGITFTGTCTTTHSGNIRLVSTSSGDITVTTTSRRTEQGEEGGEKGGEAGEAEGDGDGRNAVQWKGVWDIHWGRGDVQGQKSGAQDDWAERA